jgi:hypothetical protein
MSDRKHELSRQQRRALERRRRKASRGPRASSAALTLGALAAAAPAQGAVFTVSNLSDAGAGSLRQAILDANADTNDPSDQIVFQAGLSGTITLASGQLYLYTSMEIQGPGPGTITVDGDNASRVFYVSDGLCCTTIDVTISGLTVTGGSDVAGGGIVNFGENLTLDDVVVTGNSATGGLPASPGGGVASFYDAGALTIRDSLISGNTADLGGGLGLYYAGNVLVEDTRIESNNALLVGGGIATLAQEGTVDVRRSTISGNQGFFAGGGVMGVYLYGASTVRESTLSGNSASVGGGLAARYIYGTSLIENSTVSGNQAASGSGGGIYLYSYDAAPQIRHSTVAGNTASGAGGGIFLYHVAQVSHTIVADNTAAADNDIATGIEAGQVDLAFSLVEDPGGANVNDLGGNVLNQDPVLGPLQANGGPTATQRPGTGSPAIDAGNAAFVPPPTTDQRGFARVFGAQIDIGAVEINPGTVQLTAAAASVPENAGTATVTATRTGGVDGAASVQYTTADGTAFQPADYLTAAGILNWGDTDGAPKSFLVTIVDDPDVEGDETFTAVLSGALGAALGIPATQVLTILDNDAQLPSVLEIPTLDEYGRILLVALLGAAGALAARRRRGLTTPAVLLTLALASAEAAGPPREAARAPRRMTREVEVGRLETRGDQAVLRLAGGKTLTVPVDKLALRDRSQPRRQGRRRGAPAVAQATVQANGERPVLVKVVRDGAGNVRRVRVVVFESPERAAQAVERRRR